jgi:hypothetical protein
VLHRIVLVLRADVCLCFAYILPMLCLYWRSQILLTVHQYSSPVVTTPNVRAPTRWAKHPDSEMLSKCCQGNGSLYYYQPCSRIRASICTSPVLPE